MTPPKAYLTLPQSRLFDWPWTEHHPDPIPPAHVPSTLLRPFNIPDNLYVAALDWRVPILMALTYAITVKSLSKYNLSHGKKPWAISKTKPFFYFVVAHNIFLAIYSAWTFWGMLGVMHRSIANPFSANGLAQTVDSFCRVQGNRGLGASVYYNDMTSQWEGTTGGSALANGIPNPTVPGRLWNEGLAYYGWIFYISKFYEVLDTFIILAKGKPSSTLQTYHHTGAMMCMWAGMRFMSTPIWIFAQFNSFIHAIMYAYYTLTAYSVKISPALKRSLTTLQITQFLIGASFTTIHSFIAYDVPVTHPTGGITGPIDSSKQPILGYDVSTRPASVPGEKPTFYITQPCITNAAETFAIWLNISYLAPLTYLFISFFIASYLKRSNAAAIERIPGKPDQRRPSNVSLAEKAGWDAARSMEREVYGAHSRNNGSAAVDVEVLPQHEKQAVRRRY